MKLVLSPKYRTDIDGLRALAVLPVLIFHFGHLSNGYLGVDIFFVISGFLITGIIYANLQAGKFSLLDFYKRRTRRILPLVSAICVISLIMGIFVMLPDDLENLAQSVIATNFFGNNILQVLTTKNYWDVVNEFKPLMHTWSLGIEEQYYLAYPFIFLLAGKKRRKLILPLLMLFTIVSLVLFLSPFSDFNKFYLLQFRFFELSIGGIAAILLNGKMVKHSFGIFPIAAILLLLIFDNDFLPEFLNIITCVFLTTLILISDNQKQWLLTNKVSVAIGKISFSLYMWHQVVLAFARYAFFEELKAEHFIYLSVIIFILSFISYYLIEQPFRNKQKVKFKTVLTLLVTLFVISNAVSYYIYHRAGVLQDIPELGIEKDKVEKNMHAKYNDRIYGYDRDFSTTAKLKVLVIGNSFARDWANVLLESQLKSQINLSYIYKPKKHNNLIERAAQADIIFISGNSSSIEMLQIKNRDKVYFVGPKNFGVNNGIYYNNRDHNYCLQKIKLSEDIQERNKAQQLKLGDQYINLIGSVIDENGRVPIFTPECQFISQDCRHFTVFGAKFFAQLLDPRLKKILANSHKPAK